MEKIEIIKKISKIVFYASASFALIFGAINWHILTWSKIQQNGSIQSVACNLSVEQYKQDQRLTDEDSFVSKMKGLCNGVSSVSSVRVIEELMQEMEIVE